MIHFKIALERHRPLQPPWLLCSVLRMTGPYLGLVVLVSDMPVLSWLSPFLLFIWSRVASRGMLKHTLSKRILLSSNPRWKDP